MITIKADLHLYLLNCSMMLNWILIPLPIERRITKIIIHLIWVASQWASLWKIFEFGLFAFRSTHCNRLSGSPQGSISSRGGYLWGLCSYLTASCIVSRNFSWQQPPPRFFRYFQSITTQFLSIRFRTPLKRQLFPIRALLCWLRITTFLSCNFHRAACIGHSNASRHAFVHLSFLSPLGSERGLRWVLNYE